TGGGTSSGGGSTVKGTLRGAKKGTLTNNQQKSSKKISSIYDLINTQVSVPGASDKEPATVYASPLNDAGGLQQNLPLLLDKTTTSKSMNIAGRININTAPQEVLMTLPNLTPTDVQTILTSRPQANAAAQNDPTYQTPAWLVTNANVAPATLKKLEKLITA